VRAGDAIAAAADWVRQAWDRPGVVGAYVMGSLAARPDDAEFNERASDIDVAVVVDADQITIDRVHYPHGRFLAHGPCLVQEILVPRSVFDDEGSLLTMLGLGCNLRHARILLDGAGVLTQAQATVWQRWEEPEWLNQRVERAVRFMEAAVDRVEQADDDAPRLAFLCDAVSQAAGLLAIAAARTPTHRRALVLARSLDAEVADALLACLGASDADAAAVDELVDVALAALGIERRVVPDPPDLSPAFRERMPAFFAAGVRELVDDGFPREAVLPALSGVAVSASIVQGADPEMDELVRRAAAATDPDRVRQAAEAAATSARRRSSARRTAPRPARP